MHSMLQNIISQSGGFPIVKKTQEYTTAFWYLNTRGI